MFPPLDHPLYDGLFGDPAVAAHLSAGAEVAAMIRVERALARAEGAVGVIPSEAAEAIDRSLEGAVIDPADLAAGTTSAGVPVPALVAALRGLIPGDAAHWLHWGATSHDIMDGGLVLRLRAVLDIHAARLDTLIGVLADMAEVHMATPMAGRTRSQVATPIGFGLRVAQWLHPLLDLRDRLGAVRAGVLKVQFGGASGANSAVAPDGMAIMQALARELDLAPALPWHTNRVALADLAAWCAAVTTATAKMAGDAVLMLRREAAELSLQGGGGSSTMPNKTNPVLAEAILTLARHAATLGPALLVPHAEERDGPAWMTEWVVLPQVLVATGAAMTHAIDLTGRIAPDPHAMTRALQADGGAALAEAASFALARTMPRAEAQALVKQASATARAEGRTLAETLAELAPDADLTDALSADRPETLGADIAEALIARARTPS